MFDRDKYRQLCRREDSIPLFSQAWWLDTVCGRDEWDVVLVEKDNQIVGSMPIYQTTKFGLKVIAHPPLTQTLGPWMRPSIAKYAKALGYQKHVLDALINQLPTYGYFSQNWHYHNTNWLPFHWRSFKQTTRYTYIIYDLTDMTKLWKNLEEKVKTEIRKATSRFGLEVRDDLTIEDFFKLYRMTFDRQGMSLPCSESFVKRVDKSCVERGQRKIFIAEDKQGKHHAGVYIVWDSNTAYYLMGGGHPELRSSGATSLCIWKAIQHSATVTKEFNFEGSMIENVERFFRGFGAIQTPYFSISKTASRILRIKQALQIVLRG